MLNPFHEGPLPGGFHVGAERKLSSNPGHNRGLTEWWDFKALPPTGRALMRPPWYPPSGWKPCPGYSDTPPKMPSGPPSAARPVSPRHWVSGLPSAVSQAPRAHTHTQIGCRWKVMGPLLNVINHKTSWASSLSTVHSLSLPLC